MYDDVLIKRFELEEVARIGDAPEKDFDMLDGYKAMVAPYIYTDIKITDYTEPIQKAFQSRLQIFLSSILLRSILLKNGTVDALNNLNFPSYYAITKSFLEVPAILAHITKNLYDDKNEEDMCGIINQVSLGVRTEEDAEGILPHRPNNKQISVLTMFEKLDSILADMAKESGRSEGTSRMASAFYSDICNFAHPNFPAHISVGRLGKDHIWRAKEDNENYRNELFWYYMPQLSTTISSINILCSMLVTHSKVNNFNLMGSPLYFNL